MAGQNGAFTIHANPPEERQPTVHGFRERLRNFAFRVAAGLVRAGKLRYCVPVGDHVSAVWPIFANKCRCCVNQKGDENLEVENVWLRKYQECRVVSPERRLLHKKRLVFTVYIKKGLRR